MSVGSRIVRNTTFVFSADIISYALSFVFMIYAARRLGPEDLGVYTIAGTFGFFVTYISAFGISPMAIREMSVNRSNALKLFNDILGLRIVSVVICYTLLCIIVPLLNYDSETRYVIYGLGLASVFLTFSESFAMLYAAFEMMQIPAATTVLVTFLSTTTKMGALYLGYGLRGIVAVNVVGGLLGVIISGIWVRKKVFKYSLVFRPRHWLDLMKQALPFGILGALSDLDNEMGILLLSKLPGPYPAMVAIGHYKPAQTLMSRIALVLPASFRTAVLPSIAYFREDLSVIRTILDKSSKYFVIFLGFPLIFFCSFFNEKIITVFFGPDYLPGAPVLLVLGWAYMIQAFNIPINVTLGSSREISRFIPWAACVSLVQIILFCLLIPRYSFLGLAVATLAAKAIGLLVRFHLLKSIWKIGFSDLKESIRAGIGVLAAFLISWLLSYLHLHPVIFASLCLTFFVLLLFIFGILTKREMIYMIISLASGKSGMRSFWSQPKPE